MQDQTTEVVLNIQTDADTDIEELAELTQQLREELLELDVENVNLLNVGEIPEKAKAVDPVSWGTLLVTFVSAGGISTLINTLQSWLSRHEQRSVTLKIGDDELVVTGISSNEQQRLINAWISRHRGFVVSDE
jgi:hypothetical protein